MYVQAIVIRRHSTITHFYSIQLAILARASALIPLIQVPVVEERPEVGAVQEEILAAPHAAVPRHPTRCVAGTAAGEVRVPDVEVWSPGRGREA